MSVSRNEMLRRVQKIAAIPLIDWDGCVTQVRQLHEVLLENFQWREKQTPAFDANGSFAAIKVDGRRNPSVQAFHSVVLVRQCRFASTRFIQCSYPRARPLISR